MHPGACAHNQKLHLAVHDACCANALRVLQQTHVADLSLCVYAQTESPSITSLGIMHALERIQDRYDRGANSLSEFPHRMSNNALFDQSPDVASERVLLVMLPGVNDRAASFFSQGIVRTLRERRLPVDALGIDADFPAYADGSLLPRLRDEIDRVGRERRIDRLWFLGTSLGGMGALMYCRAYPASTDGVVLLAPYLASRRVLVQIARAGGLEAWCPDPGEPGDMEWRVLDWLRRELRDRSSELRVHLGYGLSDPFAQGSTLLEALLPAQRSLNVAGGHDWPTWSALWARVLDQGPFEAKTARII